MWQVILYLANERQVRERQGARVAHRTRRWWPGRRATGAPTGGARTEATTRGVAPRVH